MINSKIKRGSDTSDDISAYDLIMKNKERLLSFDEPVRFIFSHSALKEGWDNPNVFQIATLRQSSSDIKTSRNWAWITLINKSKWGTTRCTSTRGK